MRNADGARQREGGEGGGGVREREREERCNQRCSAALSQSVESKMANNAQVAIK